MATCLTPDAEQGLALLKKVDRYFVHGRLCHVGDATGWRNGDEPECDCGLAELRRALVQAIDQGRSAPPSEQVKSDVYAECYDALRQVGHSVESVNVQADRLAKNVIAHCQAVPPPPDLREAVEQALQTFDGLQSWAMGDLAGTNGGLVSVVPRSDALHILLHLRAALTPPRSQGRSAEREPLITPSSEKE